MPCERYGARMPIVDMYSWEEGRRRQRTAPTRCGFSGVELSVSFDAGEECHKATRVMLWCGSVMVSL